MYILLFLKIDSSHFRRPLKLHELLKVLGHPDRIPVPPDVCKPVPLCSKKSKMRSWTVEDISPTPVVEWNNSVRPMQELTLVQLFECFFDDEVINMVCTTKKFRYCSIYDRSEVFLRRTDIERICDLS
nr:unnamed protein product [Callosobruchus chinensis]